MKKKTKEVWTDYRSYQLRGAELLVEVLFSLLPGLLLNLLFYRSVWALLLVPPCSFFFLRLRVLDKKKKRDQILRRDFRQALAALSVSLDAGHSIENAFPAVTRHLAATCGENAAMTQEFLRMERQVRQMRRPEELLQAFAGRTDDEDIRRFATVFSIASTSGGPLSDIVRDAAREISEKIEAKQEVETILAAKKYEQRIMALIPAGLIIYLQFASPGFLDPLYSSLAGRLVMSVALIVYLFAFLWGKKIAEVSL